MAESRWLVVQDEAGLQTILERLAESRAEGDDEAVAFGLLALAFQVIWVRSDNDEPPFVRCGTLAREALEIFRRLDHVKGQVAAIHRLVPSVDPDERARLLAEADRLAMASGDEVLVAKSLAAQARQIALTDRDMATRLAREALEVFLRRDEKIAAAGCLMSLSIYPNDSKEKYESAIESARLYRESGRPGDASRSLSIAIMNGESFLPYVDLEPLIRRMLADAQTDGNRSMEEMAYRNMAKLESAKGNAEEAEKYVRWARELVESDGMSPGERHRFEVATTTQLLEMAKNSGNAETIALFEEELKRLKKHRPK